MTFDPQAVQAVFTDPLRARKFVEAVHALLEETDEAPLKQVGERMGDDNISALRRVRRQLMGVGFVVQFKMANHFQVSLSHKGEEFWSWLQERPEWPTFVEADTTLPEVPFRVGMDHLLPSALYKKMVRTVNAGSYDLLVIPRDKPTKIKYWDEA